MTCSVASLLPVSVPSVPADRSRRACTSRRPRAAPGTRRAADGATRAGRAPRSNQRVPPDGRGNQVGDRRRRPDRRPRHSTRRARISMSRGMVAAAPYSQASSRKPGGGGGSSMCSIKSPEAPITCTYRLSGRCMKGNFTPGASSSTRDVVAQVGAHAPVLLLEDVVVDPTASRRLEQRVVQQQEATTAGLQDPCHLLDRRLERVEMLDHEAHHDRVERRIAERQPLGARLHVPRAASPSHSFHDLGPGGVDTDRLAGRPRRHDERSDLRHTRRRAPDARRPGAVRRAG